ncbi:hypothetical protein B0H19DRAFT_1365347 [Mycena capillaripes]|nr:hypothetical protein B0H19DRAFT_1365347 [Mycena capillaripes]
MFAEGGQCSSCKTPIFRSSLLSQPTRKDELHKLLRSNEYPTHFQASHCQEIISSLPTELERYDVHISRLRLILEKAEHERSLVEDYLRLCQYTLSPVRRLPSEILTEIFAFFLPGWTTSRNTPFISSLNPVEEELGRIANVELMRISQVCPRWHQIIMGTPSLWSVVGLSLGLWHGPNQARMMPVLESSLARGGDFPLDLRAQARPLYSTHALALLPVLAQSSRRWRKVSFTVDYAAHMTAMSMVKDNLPLLETLQLDINLTPVSEFNVAEVTSFFAVAPRLTGLRYCGPSQALSSMPLEQLQLIYLDVQPRDVDSLISIMPRFSHAKCQCTIRVKIEDDSWTATDLPTVTSTMSILDLTASAFDTDEARPMLTKFMTRLTLPKAICVRLLCQQYQDTPQPWPHSDFLAFSHRSSFCNRLLILRLESVFITEPELLQVLSGLPLLQDLAITDHRIVDGEREILLLVSNSLLQRLIWTPDAACLVPALSILETHTLLQFDDTVYRDFVLSRLKPGRNTEGPFEVDLRWYPGYCRQLDPAIVAQFGELQSQGQLLFSSAESTLFPNMDAEDSE